MDRDEARGLLEQARDQLARVRAEAMVDSGSAGDGPEPAWADRGEEMAERSTGMAIAADLDAERSEIDAALVRLDQGRYGLCEECGEAIGAERLQALAWARYCIRHSR